MYTRTKINLTVVPTPYILIFFKKKKCENQMSWEWDNPLCVFFSFSVYDFVFVFSFLLQSFVIFNLISVFYNTDSGYIFNKIYKCILN